MSRLEQYGPWALIAGASEGTGSAFARRLAAEGFRLILVARREGPLATLAEAVRAEHGTECVTASIDLSAPDAIDAVRAVTAGREVGLFVSNAGSDPNSSTFIANDVQAWIDLVERNVTNTVRITHLLAGPMAERGRGGILLIGSGACYGGAPGLHVYSGTKAFVMCFAEGLWAELRHKGVDVLNYNLSRTDTPEFRRLLGSRGVPVPDGLADPDDVARIALDALPRGPVQNWGSADEEQGFAPFSGVERRERVLLMERLTQDLNPAD